MAEPTMNQYAPPEAHVADIAPSGGVAELKLFSHRGRIGRLRYLAYGAAGSLIYYMIIGALAAALRDPSALAVVSLVAFGFMLWFGAITGIKRCHDMNISGWWTLTMFIPVIVFAWIFWPGSKGENRFGAPPPRNGVGVWVLGLLMPFLLTGILAAVAIPAYKAYTDKARAAQQQQLQQQQAPQQ